MIIYNLTAVITLNIYLMKFVKIKLLTLFMALYCLVGVTDSFAQTSLFSFERYVNNQGDTLNFRLLVPDYTPLNKYPLVIFLHGSGERGSDNKAQLKWGVMNFASNQNMKLHPSIVIAPQCPKNMTWSNFSSKDMSLMPSPSKPMKLLFELIHQLIKNLPVDTTRIYITGLSMGGYGTYDAILRQADLFAAAVPVCGAGDVTKAATIAHIPIWIFHGALDRTVNAVLSHKMLDALTKAGANPGFTQYPEVGHFSWIAAYSDPMMMEWLFKQHKSSN